MLEDMLERFINSVNVLNRQKGVIELDPHGCAYLPATTAFHTSSDTSIYQI